MWLHEAHESQAAPEAAEIRKLLETDAKLLNDGIIRNAVKMATGTGKTRVMAMLCAWWWAWRTSLGEISVCALALTPNLTIKRRLAELNPNTPAGEQAYRDIMPPGMDVPRLTVAVENYHQFQPRAPEVAGERLSSDHKKLLTGGHVEAMGHLQETPDDVLARKLPDHVGMPILVLNDEAHHCYRPPQRGRRDPEIKEFEKQAGIWYGVLKTLDASPNHQLGIVVDLSATPMYMRMPPDAIDQGVGDSTNPLFTWTVCDTPLIEAVECGLTKIPRAATRDSGDGSEAERWRNVFKSLPKEKRLLAMLSAMPLGVAIPLQAMAESLSNEQRRRADAGAQAPVLILIANSIENAEELYDYVAGTNAGEGRWRAGQCGDPISNVKADKSGPKAHPPTLLVHSKFASADNSVSDKLKGPLKHQESFFPKRDKESADEYRDRLQNMFDTVAQPGKPGEHIRCVVSVSMLTEGWDCKSVTHVFGFRPFDSQLLCEQAVGRALRRSAHPSPGSGAPGPEYADVVGVPFEFMRGGKGQPPSSMEIYPVELALGFGTHVPMPQVDGYESEQTAPMLTFRKPLNISLQLVDRPRDIVELTGMAGDAEDYPLNPPHPERWQAILYEAAGLATEGLCEAQEMRRVPLFAQLLAELKEWSDRIRKVKGKEGVALASRLPCDFIAHNLVALATANSGDWIMKPVFSGRNLAALADPGARTPYRTTQMPRHDNAAGKQLHTWAPCHSGLEVRTAQAFDALDGVSAWVRNFRVGWRVPWQKASSGAWRWYEPDFAVRLANDVGDVPVMLMVECKGFDDPDEDEKSQWVRQWWLPCVNRHAVLHRPDWGVWDYCVIRSDDVEKFSLAALVESAAKSHERTARKIIQEIGG